MDKMSLKVYHTWLTPENMKAYSLLSLQFFNYSYPQMPLSRKETAREIPSTLLFFKGNKLDLKLLTNY